MAPTAVKSIKNINFHEKHYPRTLDIVNRLAVLPEYRRQGYAMRLVAEAERVLHAQGMTVIAVLIEPGNDDSLALFGKLGYLERPNGMHYLSKRDSEYA